MKQKIIFQKTIFHFILSPVEGCEGNKKVEKVYIRSSNQETSSINASMLCPSGGFNPDTSIHTIKRPCK